MRRNLFGQVAACGDDLGHCEILRIVDVQPLDAVHNRHVGSVSDPAVPSGPQDPREDEERAGFDIHRLDGLRAGDVFGRIVERPSLVPRERLYLSALNAESYSPETTFRSASATVSARIKGDVACAST